MTKEQNKKAPNLRFKGFTNDWEQRKLYEVADYRNGKAHEQHIYIHGNYIVVNSKFVSTSGKAKKYSDKLIEPLMKNEIAFVLSDVPNGKALARTFLVKRSQKYTLNQRVAGITPHPNMNSYFLFILMNRNPYFLKFDDGVGQTNLSKKDVEQFNENYPTKREQQKIGEIFVKLDSLLTLQQRKLDLLKQLKKGLLQKMFADKGSKRPILRFEGFNNEWECKKLGDIARMYQPKTITSSKLASTGYPVFGANGYIGFYSEANHMDDQVTISARGEGTGTPSYVKGPVWITSNSMVINVDNSGIDKAFLFNNLSAHSLKKYVTGGAQPQLTREVLKGISIMLSGQNEQTKIGDLSKRLIKIISVQQNKLSKLKDVKKALLQQMFI